MRLIELPVPAADTDVEEASRVLTMKPFDWRRDAHGDFDRQFPPIVGRGRGHVMGEPNTSQPEASIRWSNEGARVLWHTDYTPLLEDWLGSDLSDEGPHAEDAPTVTVKSYGGTYSWMLEPVPWWRRLLYRLRLLR